MIDLKVSCVKICLVAHIVFAAVLLLPGLSRVMKVAG